MRPVMSADASVELIPDGATLTVGGFIGVGAPQQILRALAAYLYLIPFP